MRKIVVISVNKREGDRAIYRLFALYGEFDKVIWVWYNVKKMAEVLGFG